VEEAGVPGENHRPWASNWLTLSLAAASRVHLFFVIYKAGREPTPYLDVNEHDNLSSCKLGHKLK